MKLQFKKQQFQLDAVASVVDVFAGQGKHSGFDYHIDKGQGMDAELDMNFIGFRNAPIRLSQDIVSQKVRKIQQVNHLKPSKNLSIQKVDGRPSYNLTIEMETGTGKTYTYIRTLMELNKQYGWLKFIIVVPSIAIREGVLKSFEMMADHFQLEYGKKPRYFVYDSSRLGELDKFANSSDIQVMIINSQAFNSKGTEANRINNRQESFRWRKPIDVIAATNPILIIDEPQSVEGKKTKERLVDFKPLFTLRYSATHKDKHDMIYRLDALDAYNKKLVKKIAVKTVEQTSTTGTQGYLYLQELVPQKSGPKARIEFEMRTKSGNVKRVTKLVEEPFVLFEESGNLPAYQDGWTLSNFDAFEGENSIQIGANRKLHVGEVIGETNEDDIRRIQIRETIASHLQKEEGLYKRGIKVLSLFFIDEVAKYKCYDDQNDAYNGTYAQMFEEEYEAQVKALLADPNLHGSNFWHYLNNHQEGNPVHAGYFSVDKVKKSDKVKFVDYKSATEKRNNQSNDKDAFDLIMKDKERLLSFDEPVRFIFSHSALKEGWDNPNVFQICTLKNTGTETEKRQKIGRGMRLAVDQKGVRQDEELLGADVHNINKLTVIANESYEDFAKNLQKELKEILADRPSKVEVDLFVDKVLENEAGQKLTVTKEVAKEIECQLIKQDYIDSKGNLTATYFEQKETSQFVLSENLAGYEVAVKGILETIYDANRYQIERENDSEVVFAREINPDNYNRQEFKRLWESIHHKSTYYVEFDDEELIEKSIKALNEGLFVKKPSYMITEVEAKEMKAEQGLDFKVNKDGKRQAELDKTSIQLRYDLLGEIASRTELKRKTIANILNQISPSKFEMFAYNPEAFIQRTSRLINEQKASQVIEHIRYNILEETFDTSVFTDNPESGKLSDKRLLESRKGVYNYVKVDSDTEQKFKEELDQFEDVMVYTKLPSKFKISTPLGDYNPDWAIAFRDGSVKHVYFVAETKGSMSSLQLKGAELAKIECAKAHFKALKEKGLIEDERVYGVVDSYESLLSILK
ncbi:type III restriction-modification system endonuclease [Streptococcus porcorum]|uniref:Type III restriction enzyme n=1 Tax=Streptococcus porcorum TaxID=701526 RepID=A0ABV2JEH7_9STRE